MAFSPESFARLLERHPRKRRIQRRLRGGRGKAAGAPFPERTFHELLAVCHEIEALDRGLVSTLEERIASPEGRAHLRALWRRVRDENREQIRFAGAWLGGGVFDAAELRQVADSITREQVALRAFARDFQCRVRGQPRARRLDHGEAPPVLTLDGGTVVVRVDPVARRGMSLVYKRMACFDSRARATAYLDLSQRYGTLLRDGCGLQLPWQGGRVMARPGGRWQVYLTQARVPSAWIAGQVLATTSADEWVGLTRRIWDEIFQVWRYNESQPEAGLQLGLDGRIGRWAVVGFDPTKPRIRGDETLLFLGGDTPFLLQRGRPLLDHHVVTRGAPARLADLLDPLVESELARHHDLRTVLIDYIASCDGNRRAAVQPRLIELVNTLRQDEIGRWVRSPVSQDEVLRHQRSEIRRFRLLRSLSRIGEVVEALRTGRNPHPFETARDLLTILTKPVAQGPGSP